MNPDFLDLLRALSDANARFLVVGAYAVGVHGRPRAELQPARSTGLAPPSC
jgi:hypothetical protein